MRNSQEAIFKQNESAAAQTFTPDQLQGYGFDKEQKMFESHLVPATTEGAAPQRLFLNVIAKGKASLYYYRDAFQKENYYLAKDNGELLALKQQIRFETDPATGRKRKVTDKKFLNVLTVALADCPSMSRQQLLNANLAHKSLIGIVAKYNQCVAPSEVAYAQQNKKSVITVAPAFVYALSNVSISGDSKLAARDFENSTAHYGGGISVNFTLPNLNEKLSVQTDLLYAPHKFYSYQYEENWAGRKTSSEATFDLAYLKLPAQLRYTFPKGKIRPFLNAGPVFSYLIRFKDTNIINSSFSSTSYTEETTALPEDGSKPYSFGLTSGVGLSYMLNGKILSLEARYEVTEGFSGVSDAETKLQSTYIMLSYGF
ncbi:porin family protein [Pontibacter akesuensis]|uniref:porin family protein n=1 Tax=Pontibacter akesuensis TaxID=388950 RepID=UPI001560B931|nr:porin family protein [Pontibacter akesuensis]